MDGDEKKSERVESDQKKNKGSRESEVKTSRLREFFVKLPLACGLDPAVAEIEGRRNGEIFDYEVKNPGSIFKNNGVSTRSRMAPAFNGWAVFADNRKVAFALELATLAADAYEVNRNGRDKRDLINRAKMLKEGPKEILDLLTIDEALETSVWV